MRRHFNTHAEVNAGFCFTLDSAGKQITSLRVVFGNIGNGPIFCEKTAKSVANKDFSIQTLVATLPTLASELIVKPPTIEDPNFVQVDAEYRKSLALGLFYKAFLAVLVEKLGDTAVDAKLLSAAKGFDRPMSKGFQTFQADPADAPIGQAIMKVEAPKLAAGEVKFAADWPCPPRTTYAAPVLATQLGKLVSIDASSALKLPDVVGFVSADDISKMKGKNSLPLTAYQIFASGNIQHVGQMIGVVCGMPSHFWWK